MDKLTNIGTIKEVLARHGFVFSKGLGQNFLINPSVCPKIASAGCIENEGVIEIGPGIGTLTVELAKYAKKVAAIEIDRRLMPVLAETLSGFGNIKIINNDILKTDIKKLISDEFSGYRVSVCANLPYYITSPVIMHILESKADVESLTVMVQREVARRLCAGVGSREAGAITAAVNYYGRAKQLFDVSRGSFMPAPKVDSAVIKIDIDRSLSTERSDIGEMFFRILKAGFSQRRKTLANALEPTLNIMKTEIAGILTGMGISEEIRIERMKMEDLILLADTLRRRHSNKI